MDEENRYLTGQPTAVRRPDNGSILTVIDTSDGSLWIHSGSEWTNVPEQWDAVTSSDLAKRISELAVIVEGWKPEHRWVFRGSLSRVWPAGMWDEQVMADAQENLEAVLR